MARLRYIALGVGVAVLGLGLLAWLSRPRDEPARATVDDALRAFRQDARREDRRRTAGADGPPHGVYRYATYGSESVQTGVGGALHDYDGTSTIALSDGGCGQVERWQVLEGRWSEAESCRTPRGYALRSLTEFHEFFDVAEEDVYRCRGAAVPALARLRLGARFGVRCDSADASLATSSRVAGFGAVTIGGRSFSAIRTVSKTRLGGETSGSARREEWRRRSDGLLLRRRTSSEAETSANGGASYSERYTLRLLDATPRR